LITSRELKFFDVARAAAKLSTWSEHSADQTGAAIVLRNEVIAIGYNRRKTSPTQAYWAEKAGRPEAIWLHAEIAALQKLGYGARDLHLGLGKIFVFRETMCGLGIAKPCEICTMALMAFGITNIYYTSEEGYVNEKWIKDTKD
jgi:deoxycytidylate deaminase